MPPPVKEYLPLGPTQFNKAKGHQETKKRRARRQHIDDEGTVELSFFKDGFILRESISWDGETDTTRVVLLPVEKKVDYRATVIRIETAWRARRKRRARRMMKLGGKKKKVLRKASASVSPSHITPICEEALPSRDTNADSEAASDAGGSQTT